MAGRTEERGTTAAATRHVVIPSARVCVETAGLAARNGRRLYVSSGILARRDMYGPAAALAVTAFEEAIKAAAWLYLGFAGRDSREERETAELVFRSLRAHTGRLALAGPVALLTDPRIALAALVLLGIRKLALGKTDNLLIDPLRDPQEAAGALAHIWRIRQRGLYVDVASGGSAMSVTEEEMAEVRSLALLYVRGILRLVQPGPSY